MPMSTEEAWRKAANCAVLVQQAPDEATRFALVRMRNSWIAIANDSAVLGSFDGYAALSIHPEDAAAVVPALTVPVAPLRA